MHTIDIALVCVVVLALLACAAILARQRFMLRAPGSIPVAVNFLPSAPASRWQYGVGRYSGGELRWYRSLGFGTRPSAVLHRRDVRVLSRRAPRDAELSAVPATSVILECRSGDRPVSLALGESAYTGFVSWLEASAPMT